MLTRVRIERPDDPAVVCSKRCADEVRKTWLFRADGCEQRARRGLEEAFVDGSDRFVHLYGAAGLFRWNPPTS